MQRSLLLVLAATVLGVDAGLLGGDSNTNNYDYGGTAGSGAKGIGGSSGSAGPSFGGSSGRMGRQSANGGTSGSIDASGMSGGNLDTSGGSNTGPTFNGNFNQVAAGAAGAGAMDVALARAGGDMSYLRGPSGPMADFRQDASVSGSGNGQKTTVGGTTSADGGQTRGRTGNGGSARSKTGNGGKGKGGRSGDANKGGNKQGGGNGGDGKLDFSPTLSVPMPARRALERRALELEDEYDWILQQREIIRQQDEAELLAKRAEQEAEEAYLNARSMTEADDLDGLYGLFVRELGVFSDAEWDALF